MRELGEVLRRRREELGASLDDVQAATKIRKRYLQAIEDGDWSVLPGEVYARGFVRAYAEYLGLDGQALLAQYFGPETAVRQERASDHTAPPDLSAPLPEGDTHRQREPRRAEASGAAVRRSSRRVNAEPPSPLSRFWSEYGAQALTVAAILVVLGGGWYWLSAANRHGGSPPIPGNAGANAPAAGTVSNTQNGTVAPGNMVTNETVAAGNRMGTNATSPVPPATTVTAAPRNGSVQMYVVTTTATSFTVELTAQTGPCWVAVTADGRVVDGNDTVPPGQSRTWQAQQSLDVRAGDAAVIRVMVDGQPVAVPPVAGPLHLKFVRGS